MHKYPTPDSPTFPRPRPGDEPPTQQLNAPSVSQAPAKAAPDLTVNKVIAGAGAAATSAVLGSYFGAGGTVTGAALGSAASMIATVIYQRSLDRTRDTLVAKVRLTPGRRADIAVPVASAPPEARVRMPTPRQTPDAETVRLRVEPDIRPARRRAWLWIGATVLVFAIGLLTVTGVEWAKGSSLTTGESGTSVGRVIDGNRGAAAPTEEPESTETTATPEPSSSPEPSTDPTEEPTPSDSSESDSTSDADPSDSPGLGGGNGSQQDESGARRTPLPLDQGE